MVDASVLGMAGGEARQWDEEMATPCGLVMRYSPLGVCWHCGIDGARLEEIGKPDIVTALPTAADVQTVVLSSSLWRPSSAG